MSYPKLYRDLYENDGAGPLLREDIIPNNVVKVSAQTLTSAQKTQARTNIDAQSASGLKTALEELIVEFGGTVPTE